VRLPAGVSSFALRATEDKPRPRGVREACTATNGVDQVRTLAGVPAFAKATAGKPRTWPFAFQLDGLEDLCLRLPFWRGLRWS